VEAGQHYRKAIRLLAAGDPAAREEFRLATSIAPIEPELYLPLARACRDRGLDQRAAEYYKKDLASKDPAEASEASRELAELDADLDVAFDAQPAWPITVAIVVGAVAVAIFVIGGAAAWLAWMRALRRRLTLARLVAENPELQPAIAYLCGCLRHEL